MLHLDLRGCIHSFRLPSMLYPKFEDIGATKVLSGSEQSCGPPTLLGRPRAQYCPALNASNTTTQRIEQDERRISKLFQYLTGLRGCECKITTKF